MRISISTSEQLFAMSHNARGATCVTAKQLLREKIRKQKKQKTVNQSNQSWLSAKFGPRAFLHVGRPWINWLAVPVVLIQIIMSFILSSVCSSCHSFVRSFLPSFSGSFIFFFPVLCLSFLADSLFQDGEFVLVANS